MDIEKHSWEAIRARGKEFDEALARKFETIDLSKTDLLVVKSSSDELSEVDKLLSAQILRFAQDQYGKKVIVLIMRPEESVEALGEEKARQLYEKLKKRFEI